MLYAYTYTFQWASLSPARECKKKTRGKKPLAEFLHVPAGLYSNSVMAFDAAGKESRTTRECAHVCGF